LRLAAAWQRVAGGEIAARLEPTGVSRGVVELAAVGEHDDDPGVEALALLTGRLARACPDLGIRRFRVVVAGRAGRKPASLEVAPAADADVSSPAEKPPAAPSREAPRERPEETRDERLRRVMRLYLERGEGR
jgi:hypothetical protein